MCDSDSSRTLDPSSLSLDNMDPLDHLGATGFFQDDSIVQGRSQQVHWLNKDIVLNKDNPWNPIGMANHARLMPDFLTNRTNTAAFQGYRSTGIPSECDTVPGDSAYGSGVPASIEDRSVYDDDHGSCIPNVEQELGCFHLNEQGIGEAQYALETLPPGLHENDNSSDYKYYCHDCNQRLKTKSELNKHHSRHNKPHRCSHPNCDKKFASPNDLTRHRSTYHNEYSLVQRIFVCRHDGCDKKEPKRWPRADNFRSHLTRVHKLHVSADDDLTQYLFQPTFTATNDLEDVGINLPDSTTTNNSQKAVPGHGQNKPMRDITNVTAAPQSSSQHMSNNPQMLMNRKPFTLPQTGSNEPSRFIQPKMLNRQHQLPPSPSQLVARQATGPEPRPMNLVAHSQIAPSRTGFSIIHPTQTPTGQYSSRDSMPSSVQSGSSDSEEEDDDIQLHEKSLEDQWRRSDPSATDRVVELLTQRPEQALGVLRGIPEELLLKAMRAKDPAKEPTGSETPATPKSKIPCDQCGKEFGRPCELKKHARRHKRPYGCTDPGCDKAFGSKNDWKRHENGQHDQPEAWHCDEDCRRIFYRRDAFKAHLLHDHRLGSTVLVDEKLENNRLGSPLGGFWCGFCQNLILPDTSDGTKSTDKRFNHIDEHYMGRNGFAQQSIEDWCHMKDLIDRNGVIRKTSQETTEASDNIRKRKRNRQADARPAKHPHTVV